MLPGILEAGRKPRKSLRWDSMRPHVSRPSALTHLSTFQSLTVLLRPRFLSCEREALGGMRHCSPFITQTQEVISSQPENKSLVKQAKMDQVTTFKPKKVSVLTSKTVDRTRSFDEADIKDLSGLQSLVLTFFIRNIFFLLKVCMRVHTQLVTHITRKLLDVQIPPKDFPVYYYCLVATI